MILFVDNKKIQNLMQSSSAFFKLEKVDFFGGDLSTFSYT